jgi:dTDP-4-amino-4,6-dideoxygalactose transaminase
MMFLNGGKACLVLISDYLLDHGVNRILLPSYLCPTIVATLERNGLTCDYYQINPDLSINLDDLAFKVKGIRAVYFINYFGFSHPFRVRDFLADLQQKGVFIVEDNAQAGFTENNTGDFIFNSIRKLAAYDGGYLITPLNLMPYKNKYKDIPNRRLPVIRDYRKRLAAYQFQGIGNHDELVRMYELAETYYDTDLVIEGDPQEREGIEHLDWEGIKQIRRENYNYLLNLISGITDLSPMYPALQEDNMPLGLPVLVSGVPRDWLLNELGNAGIGLIAHWDGLLHDPRLNSNPIAVDLASRILTLVIDQRTSHKGMDYLVRSLIDSIDASKKRPAV